MYQEMATKYTDIAFGKVDIDENADSSMEYEISAVRCLWNTAGLLLLVDESF
jgi:hypothetical protein